MYIYICMYYMYPCVIYVIYIVQATTPFSRPAAERLSARSWMKLFGCCGNGCEILHGQMGIMLFVMYI